MGCASLLDISPVSGYTIGSTGVGIISLNEYLSRLPLELTPAVRALIAKQKARSPFSESSLANRVSFRDTYDFYWSKGWPGWLEGQLRGGARFVTPVDLSQTIEVGPVRRAIDANFAYGPFDASAAGALVSEFGARCRVETDRDQSDYLYAAAQLSKLEENAGPKIRQNLRRLERRHVVVSSALALEEVSEVRACLQRWAQHRRLSSDDADVRACEVGIDLAYDGLLNGFGVHVDGELQAFVICDTSVTGMVIALFLKTAVPIQGLTDYCFREVARQAQPDSTINLCQDLGIAGLRSKKMSLGPLSLTEKFYVYPSAER